MAKRDKYRNKKLSDFFNYTEGKMSDKERNAFERRLQKDPFDADAAEGLSKVSREEAEQDLQSAAERIRMRVEGDSSPNKIGRGGGRASENESQAGENRKTGEERGISGNRNSGRKQRIGRSRRIAWYSTAAAIASLMIVTTVFFRLNENGLERFETAPEMREAAREQAAPLQEGDVKHEVPLGDAEMEQEEPAAEAAMEQEEQEGPMAGKEVEQQEGAPGADVKEQEEPAGEAMEKREVYEDRELHEDREVYEKQIQKDDAAFPVTAGPDAKKGYDLKEMQIHEKAQTLDQEVINLARELPVADEEIRQAVEEDHAFAREKMEKEAAAGRYNRTEQRMAAPEAAKEPTTAYDLQAPLTAEDIVLRGQKATGISEQLTGTVSGLVRSADDLEPLPGAVVKLRDSEKVTVADMEGRFTLDVTTNDEETLEVSYIGMKTEEVPATTDQPVEIALIPEEISLDEAVVIGYDSSKKSQLTASTTSEEVEPAGTVNFESAAPAKGFPDFRNYVNSTLVYPEPIESPGKEVVVLKFTVSPEGRPQNFRVIRAPDNEAFEKEAIRVVSEGPAWQPATRNGQHTEEEVRLRIVFRKD